jgi:membrane protease YdiL (CAAX protease family)
MLLQLNFMKQRRVSFVISNGLLLLLLSFLMYEVGLLTHDNKVINILEMGQSSLFDWLLGLIIAPILETFVCQYIPFLIFQAFTKNNLFPIIFSSLFFGVSHSYSPLYIIFGTMAGFILANAYVMSQRRIENAFVNVAMIHFTSNLIEFTYVWIKNNF